MNLKAELEISNCSRSWTNSANASGRSSWRCRDSSSTYCGRRCRSFRAKGPARGNKPAPQRFRRWIPQHPQGWHKRDAPAYDSGDPRDQPASYDIRGFRSEVGSVLSHSHAINSQFREPAFWSGEAVQINKSGLVRMLLCELPVERVQVINMPMSVLLLRSVVVVGTRPKHRLRIGPGKQHQFRALRGQGVKQRLKIARDIGVPLRGTGLQRSAVYDVVRIVPASKSMTTTSGRKSSMSAGHSLRHSLHQSSCSLERFPQGSNITSAGRKPQKR